jgi:hypothetical protein
MTTLIVLKPVLALIYTKIPFHGLGSSMTTPIALKYVTLNMATFKLKKLDLLIDFDFNAIKLKLNIKE